MDDDVWKGRRTRPRRQRQQGPRGNSKTDRYSNVTSLDLNYTQAKRMRGSRRVQQGASDSRMNCKSQIRRRRLATRGGPRGRQRPTSGGLHWRNFAIVMASASLGQTDRLSRHGHLSICWPLVVSLASLAGKEFGDFAASGCSRRCTHTIEYRAASSAGVQWTRQGVEVHA